MKQSNSIQVIIEINNKNHKFMVVDVDKKKKIYYLDSIAAVTAMGSLEQRPLSIETFIENYEDLIINKNTKLLTKLYKQSYKASK